MSPKEKPRIVPGIYVYEQKGLAGHELTKAEIDNLRRKFQPPSDEVTEFGMGIQQARSKGYTGETVTVGVLDAGACTDNLFLKDRINKKLSWNFIGNSPNVTPDWNPDYVETFPFSERMWRWGRSGLKTFR
ncbi:hypothetical protein MAR_027702 [Mya arenaria]|uniref:Uncharacterized protein n=1 Tax=Mya arenaria TaxID=6604 RepID=A0ABY7EU83_MYAAR|nr:hypothetical protein MAR_027702 [Mya arenaria]